MIHHPKSQEIEKALNRREFNKAEELIFEELNHNPESADAHYWLGVSSHFQGRIGQAIEHLKKSLHLNPNHTDAAICLSVLLNDIGRYQDAKQVFGLANQSVLQTSNHDEFGVNRKFALKHLELGDLYFRYRRHDEALEEYSKAFSLEPRDLEIRLKIAKTYAKKGFASRALQELQQMKHEEPKYIPARVQLGLIYLQQNQPLDAELEWEQVLEIDPRNSEVREHLTKLRQGKFRI